MTEPIVITFLIPAPLADKVRTAAAGIYSADKLAERVFLAWLAGGAAPRRVRPPAWRLSIVTRWRDARARGKAAGRSGVSVDRAFLAELQRRDGVRLGRRSLFNWSLRESQGGAAAMADRWAGRPKDHSADPFMQEVRRLRSAEKLSLAECHRRASETAKSRGWEVRSYKVIQVYLRRLAKSANRSNGWPATGLRTAIERQ